MSLDGVIQAPGNPDEDTSGNFKFGGWTTPYFDEFLGEEMTNQMEEPFSLLLGRITYEIFVGYWPQNASEWPGINEATKYVVSKKDLKLTWKNSVQVKENIHEEIKRLKNENGPDLYVYGSGNLIQTLFQYNLIDELWLKIFPLTLGSGKRLFAEGTTPSQYELITSKISPKGVIIANYKRKGNLKVDSSKQFSS